MNKHYNYINVGHWNIHGLTEKVNNSVINKLLDSDFCFKKVRFVLFIRNPYWPRLQCYASEKSVLTTDFLVACAFSLPN